MATAHAFLSPDWMAAARELRDTMAKPSTATPVAVRIDAGGLGPFAGGSGFGLRSTLLGYFLRVDAGWPMKGVFKGKPVWYFSLGFDF